MRLVVITAAWLVGIATGLAWGLPLLALALFLSAALCLTLLARLNHWPLLLPLAAVILILGAMRSSGASETPSNLRPWIGAGTVQLEGMITSDPEPVGAALRFRFQTSRVSDTKGWHDVKGDVQVTVTPHAGLIQSRQAPYLRYGDVLTLEGELQEVSSSGASDYGDYLARQGIQARLERPTVKLDGQGQGLLPYALAYKVRYALVEALARALPEPQASLAQAILLGVRSAIPHDVNQAFQNTGATHLLAISGMNMTMVLAMALPLSILLLGKRRNLYLLLPLVLLWAYAFVSGLSPSVVRAVIMASVYLAALGLGRPYAVLPSLSLTAALMVAQKPNLLYDVSFQLSFASLLGIILLAKPLANLANKAADRFVAASRWPVWLRVTLLEGTAVSLAATLATAPILAANFQQVSFLSVPATLLALPSLAAIMATSFATSLAGLIAPVLGQAVGWSAWLPLSYLLWVVEGMAKLPAGILHVGQVPAFLAWGYYAAMAALLFLVGPGGKQWKERLIRVPSLKSERLAGKLPIPETIALASMTLAAVVSWGAAATLPDGKLHVAFLDVGQGDAILIQTPDGQQALVDGGPSPQLIASKLGGHMPFWDRSIEMVAVSHYHEDHLAGLVEALRRYNVPVILDNPFKQDAPSAPQWEALARAERATLLEAQAGQKIRLGREVTLEVLNPPFPLIGGTESDINNNSTVLRLCYKNFSLLLPGDFAQEGETLLLDQGANVESSVLKVGHHGSATSSSEPFLAAVQPMLAVVSVGANNPYGHPATDTIARLTAIAGASNVLTTEEHGDIDLVTDGKTLWVKTAR